MGHVNKTSNMHICHKENAITYRIEILPADGALVLPAEHPHPDAALVADVVLTDADGVELYGIGAHGTGVLVFHFYWRRVVFGITIRTHSLLERATTTVRI